MKFNDPWPNSKSHLRKQFPPRPDRDHHEANIIPWSCFHPDWLQTARYVSLCSFLASSDYYLGSVLYITNDKYQLETNLAHTYPYYPSPPPSNGSRQEGFKRWKRIFQSKLDFPDDTLIILGMDPPNKLQILWTKSILVLKQPNSITLHISIVYCSVLQPSCLPSPFAQSISLVEFEGRGSFTANFTSLILTEIQMNSKYRICSNVISMNRLQSPCVNLSSVCSLKLVY